MENMLQRVKTQKSINMNGNGPSSDAKGALYSPLIINGDLNSANDNGQIMGSEKTNGATPVQPGHAYTRQVSNGPAVVSEFNPLATDELREKALNNPQLQKSDQKQATMQQILVDNYLKTQTVLNGVKLVGIDSNPSSPQTNGPLTLKNRSRQLQLSSQMVSNKNRRLTSSSSTTNIQKIQNGFNTAQPGDAELKNGTLNCMETAVKMVETGIEQTCTKQQSQSELAKI